MGCFGYICPVCKTSIRGDCFSGGEKCVLIHKRHGKELGRTEGHYDEYGRVIEDKIFRNDDKDNINSHHEICTSEFGLSDSYNFGENKILPDGNIIRMDDKTTMVWHFLENHNFDDLKNNIVFKSILKKTETEIRNYDGFTEETLNTYLYLTLPTNIVLDNDTKINNIIHEWVDSLPIYNGESGIIATHSKCFYSLPKEKQDNLPISKNDPDQSWGKVRKKYK